MIDDQILLAALFLGKQAILMLHTLTNSNSRFPSYTTESVEQTHQDSSNRIFLETIVFVLNEVAV